MTKQEIDRIRRSRLVGVFGLAVDVSLVDFELRKDGISPEDLRTTVELMLRVVGIQVVGMDEAKELDWPMLRIDTETDRDGASRKVRLEITIDDFVVITRSGNLALVSVWEKTGYLFGTLEVFLPVVRNKLSVVLSHLCNDILAANPDFYRGVPRGEITPSALEKI